jgi:mRNA interferase RelE/StbE
VTFINNVKGYKIVYKEVARKDLAKIDPKIVRAIEEEFDKLILGVSNLDIKKMEGQKIPTYRLRHGDYRVIYQVHKAEIIVLVVMADHRKAIYKRYGR